VLRPLQGCSSLRSMTLECEGVEECSHAQVSDLVELAGQLTRLTALELHLPDVW
jgi:hypothetical protein